MSLGVTGLKSIRGAGPAVTAAVAAINPMAVTARDVMRVLMRVFCFIIVKVRYLVFMALTLLDR